MFFDAHSDIWCDVTTRRLRGETDILRKHHLPRLRKGGVEGSILVIWVDPPYDKDYVKRTQQIMTCVDAEVKECDEIQIVHTYDEMMQANKAGKIYIFKGIEGLAAIEKSHENRYQLLIERIENDEVFRRKEVKVWVCTVCGFIYVGKSAPALCPVCKVPDWKFEKIERRA